MEVTELTLWLARFGVLILMYLFLFVLILALRADARAASVEQRSASKPATAQSPVEDSVRMLVVTNSSQSITGKEYPLYGTLEIGRGDTCGISIPSRFVSTRHARVFAQNGQWVVEDLGSTNGTMLNDKPLVSPLPLNPGDRLLVGDTEFTVK